jgi:hypothetical protein
MNTTRRMKMMLMIALMGIGISAKADYQKNIHKSWPMHQVKTLMIDSKFSNIQFINTRDDSVTIDVRIEIENVTGSKAEAIVSQIDFYFSINEGTVSARTAFSDRFKSNQNFKINYTINIPIDRGLDIENKFGDVTLGNLEASGKFSIQYGNIYGRNLKAPANEPIKMELKFGNATFSAINRLDAKIDYSKFSAGNIEEADLNTQYSIIKIDDLKTLNVASKYDNYTIQSVVNAEVESKFTGWTIDFMKSNFRMNTQYGDVKIGKTGETFENIRLENSYGNINITIPAGIGYQLQSETHFCEIRFPNAEVSKRIEDNNRTSILATIGKANSPARVQINSRYGKVNLNN